MSTSVPAAHPFRTGLSILFLALAAGPALSKGPPEEALGAARSITAAAVAGPLRFLADDLLEGRGPASRGDRLARTYIATAFESLGLEPGAGPGAWEQPFDLLGLKSRAPPTWTFRSGGKEAAFSWSKDFIAGTGVQEEAAAVRDAEVVFAGYGIVAPEHGWDDFKGARLEGKVLLLLNNDPHWSPDLFAGETRLYYGRWTYKYESAARQGAAGAIIVHTTPSAGYPWGVVQSSWGGEQFELPEAGGAHRLQAKAWLTEDATRRLVSLAGLDWDGLAARARTRDFKPVPLGVRTSIELANTIRKVSTANVLGLLRGRDPALRDQAVVYTAHHDHLGIGEPDAGGDRIYNGAVDNALGVAQVLAIARAFSALPQAPRRSVLFLAVGAEESGLLGSAHYAAHPTFPPEKIAADINFDGGNIWGRTKDVAIIGLGKSTLDKVVEAAAALQGRVVVGDQLPDRGYYYRSDQFSFAKIGVPSIFIDVGSDFAGRPPGWGKEQIEAWEARKYHQPADQIDASWSFEGIVEDAQLGFIAGVMVAEADEMPAWNPGDEFEALRKKQR
jgi:Zn-dependent M28 family amino/carboxypeptidase